MEEARILPRAGKIPRLVLDRRFPFVDELNISDKGNLQVTVRVDKLEVQEDENSNSLITAILNVVKAELLRQKSDRV